MRYRALDADRDMTFGAGQVNFLTNVPACVAQAILTRLLLLLTEWFLDIEEGTPYQGGVLGAHTQDTRDSVIQDRILGTDGVVSILEYASTVEPNTRAFTVTARVLTIFSDQPLVITVPFPTFLFAITDTGQQGVTDSGQSMTAVI